MEDEEEEQEEEALPEAFTVAFAGGNEHLAVSVQDLPALTVCVHKCPSEGGLLK